MKVNKRCKWYIGGLKRCKKRSVCDSMYCYFHDLNITVLECNRDEPCEYEDVIRYVPNSLDSLKNPILGGLLYVYKDNKYELDRVEETYAVFKIKDPEIDDKLIVWDKKPKDRSGVVYNRIYAYRTRECDNLATILIDGEDYYCNECFEKEYNTSIKSLGKIRSGIVKKK